MIQTKKPDKKKALNLLESAKRDLKFSLTLPVSDMSSSTIARNIYESFRMLGEAILESKGIEAVNDHVTQIKEIIDLKINLPRPLGILDILRKKRNKINYEGQITTIEEAKDAVLFAKDCFGKLFEEVKKQVIN